MPRIKNILKEMVTIIDFEYYKNNFLGTLIELEKFYYIEKKAEKYVESMLLGKKSDISEVKDAVCAVCELIYNEEKRGGIKSENTDGYSVTFSETEIFKEKVYDVIRIYLANTGLLYSGIN